MPEKVFRVALDNVEAARSWLSREEEKLRLGRQRITKISYPRSLAETLGISVHGKRSRYSDHPAEPNNHVPYVIVIEFED